MKIDMSIGWVRQDGRWVIAEISDYVAEIERLRGIEKLYHQASGEICRLRGQLDEISDGRLDPNAGQ